MNAFLKYQRPALWWAFFMLILCNIPFGSVGRSHLFFPGFDKLTHCGLFFVLTVFMGSGYIRQHGTDRLSFAAALRLFAISVIFGAIIELLQLYIFTWRSGEWADLFCDAVGAGMAIFGILVTLYASANAKS